MQFYNFFNMSNFVFPRFDFGSWAMPNFGWNNFNFFNNSFFSPWSINYSWNNNYTQPIGDTFVRSSISYPRLVDIPTLTIPSVEEHQPRLFTSPPKLDYTPSTYLAPKPEPEKPETKPVSEDVGSKSRTGGVKSSQGTEISVTPKSNNPITAPTISISSRQPVLVNYRSLTREQAIESAKKDSNLERLVTTVSKNGHKVIISEASFVNDIPYAKKGTMAVLLEAADRIGRDLTVTSALGCKTSPHSGTFTGNSHYNPTNPKIDFGGGLSPEEATKLEAELEATGLFNFVTREIDGKTAHLDAQISLKSYEAYA